MQQLFSLSLAIHEHMVQVVVHTLYTDISYIKVCTAYPHKLCFSMCSLQQVNVSWASSCPSATPVAPLHHFLYQCSHQD